MSGFNNMTEVKIANRNAGFKWFAASTVSAFKAKIETNLFDRKYWIESANTHDGRRVFFICKIDEITCDISYLHADYVTLRFDSIKDAKNVLRAMNVGVSQ